MHTLAPALTHSPTHTHPHAHAHTVVCPLWRLAQRLCVSLWSLCDASSSLAVQLTSLESRTGAAVRPERTAPGAGPCLPFPILSGAWHAVSTRYIAINNSDVCHRQTGTHLSGPLDGAWVASPVCYSWRWRGSWSLPVPPGALPRHSWPLVHSLGRPSRLGRRQL